MVDSPVAGVFLNLDHRGADEVAPDHRVPVHRDPGVRAVAQGHLVGVPDDVRGHLPVVASGHLLGCLDELRLGEAGDDQRLLRPGGLGGRRRVVLQEESDDACEEHDHGGDAHEDQGGLERGEHALFRLHGRRGGRVDSLGGIGGVGHDGPFVVRRR